MFIAMGIVTPLILLLMAQCTELFFFGLLWFAYRVTVTAMRIAVDTLFSLETEGHGGFAGIYSFSKQLGSIIASMLGGFLLQMLGEPAPFCTAALLFAVTVIVFHIKPLSAIIQMR